jgi:hypothetical protein
VNPALPKKVKINEIRKSGVNPALPKINNKSKDGGIDIDKKGRAG